MDNLLENLLQVARALAIPAAVCSPVWIVLGLRFWRRQPLLRYERRRPVPWRGIDVLVVFYLAIMVLAGVSYFVVEWSPSNEASVENDVDVVGDNIGDRGAVDSDQEVSDQQNGKQSSSPETEASPRPDAEEDVDQEQLEKAHSLLKLLRQRRDPWAILLVVLSAVVVVPIAEEFLFRLVLQGWLEAAERRLRRCRPELLSLRPGAWPIVLVSALFGAIHARPPSPPEDVERAMLQVVVPLIAYPLILALAVAWLRFRSGATAVDLGVVPSRFFSDCRTGVLAFFAVAVPIYCLQGLLSQIPDFVPDPITLFFFASTLGFLYGRTHRLVPAIVLHMALNASSVAMVLMLA